MLCRVSKALWNEARPVLYETVRISLQRHIPLSGGALTDIRKRIHDNAALIKAFGVDTPACGICHRLACKHEAQAAGYGRRRPPPLRDDCLSLDGTMFTLLNNLEKDTLRRFEWHLAKGLPESVFGAYGYLPRWQPQLQHLSLITDRDCWPTHDTLLPRGLQALTQLRSFSWRGNGHERALEGVQACIAASAATLENLTLELVDDERYQSLDHALPRDTEGHLIKLAGLRHLSISQASFEEPAEVARALNIADLRSLCVWGCVGVDALLHAVLDGHTQALQLTWFELSQKEEMCAEVPISDNEEETREPDLVARAVTGHNTEAIDVLSSFLTRAPRLESVCLHLDNWANWRSISNVLCTLHGLRRLVADESRPCHYPRTRRYRQYGFDDDLVRVMVPYLGWNAPIESVGLSIRPWKLVGAEIPSEATKLTVCVCTVPDASHCSLRVSMHVEAAASAQLAPRRGVARRREAVPGMARERGPPHAPGG